LVHEKRRNPRLVVELSGSCNGLPCEIQNISLNGLRFVTSTEIEPGAFGDLTFALPETASHLFANPSDRTIHMNVHVKWCQHLPDDIFAVGAEIFMMLDGTEEQFFAYLLRGLDEGQEGSFA